MMCLSSWCTFFLFSAFASLIYIFVIRVYLKMLALKRSFKFTTKIMFRPITGVQSLVQSSLKKYGDAHAVFYKQVQQDPDLKMIIVNFLNTPTLMILDPDLIKENLLNHHDKFDKLFKLPIELKYLGGRSLVQSKGERWKQQRKCLGPSFSFEKLESSLPLIQEVINEKFGDLAGRITEDKPIKLLEEMGFITAEVVIRFFMGEVFTNRTINGNRCDREIEWIYSNATKLELATTSLLKFILFPKAYKSLTPWTLSSAQKHLVKRAESFNDEIRKVINKRKDDLIKNEQPAKEEKFENLLSVLLKQNLANPKEVLIDDIISHFILLYFAGMDTTAHWLALSIYCLAKYPEYKKKLKEEVDRICGKNTEITYKMLSELKFLKAFMDEVLRLYTPAANLLPRVCVEPHTFQGVFIKPGVAFFPNLLSSMRNQKFFPDPDSFKPERWLSDECSKINNFAFIPFSAGPRNCIGQHLSVLEAKLVMINLLRRFDVILNPKRELILDLFMLRTPKFDDLVYFKKL